MLAGGGMAYGGAKYLDHKPRTTEGGSKYVAPRKTESLIPDPNDPNDSSFIANAQAMIDKSPAGTQEASASHHLGRGVRKYLLNPAVRPGMDTLRQGGPLSGAALGGLAGLPIGALLGLWRGGLSGILPGALKGGLAGSLGLGLLTALGHRGSGKTWGFDKKFKNPLTNYSDYFKDPESYLMGPDPSKIIRRRYTKNNEKDLHPLLQTPMYTPGQHEKPWWDFLSSEKNASFIKNASPWGSGAGSTAMPLTSIYSSPISFTQKAGLAAEMDNLSPPQRSTLMRLLQGATGAAATYIIAKYLLGLGKKTTLMSVILGGLGSYNYR